MHELCTRRTPIKQKIPDEIIKTNISPAKCLLSRNSITGVTDTDRVIIILGDKSHRKDPNHEENRRIK